MANAIVSVEKVTNEMDFILFYFGYTMKWRLNICLLKKCQIHRKTNTIAKIYIKAHNNKD